MLSLLKALVQFLVGELRPHKVFDLAKTEQNNTIHLFIFKDNLGSYYIFALKTNIFQQILITYFVL